MTDTGNQSTLDLFDSPLDAAAAMGIPLHAFSGSVVWTFELDTDDATTPPTQHLSISATSSSPHAVRAAADQLAAATQTTVEEVRFEDGTGEFLVEMRDSRHHRLTWLAQLATTAAS